MIWGTSANVCLLGYCHGYVGCRPVTSQSEQPRHLLAFRTIISTTSHRAASQNPRSVPCKPNQKCTSPDPSHTASWRIQYERKSQDLSMWLRSQIRWGFRCTATSPRMRQEAVLSTTRFIQAAFPFVQFHSRDPLFLMALHTHISVRSLP